MTKPLALLTGSSIFVYLSYKTYQIYKQRQFEFDREDYREDIEDLKQRFRSFQLDYPGLLGVFSNETEDIFKKQFIQKNSFYMPEGLQNLGNTCYMNALLQSLAGSKLFMDYVKKLWNNIKLDPQKLDSIITTMLLQLLLDLSKGSKNVQVKEFYHLMCQEFTSIYEQQDSHELLVYLQEKITKITANHLRDMTIDEGFACDDFISDSTRSSSSTENLTLLDNGFQPNDVSEIKANLFDSDILASDQTLSFIKSEDMFVEANSNPKMFEKANDCRLLKGVLAIKELSINKNIGHNPFAGAYLSTIKCLKCGPGEELHRWQIYYDISLEVKPTLQEALNQYFLSEKIEDYSCIKCSLKTYLSNFPKDLSTLNDNQQRIIVEWLRGLSYIHDLDEEIFSKNFPCIIYSRKGMGLIQKVDQDSSQALNKYIAELNNQETVYSNTTSNQFQLIYQKILCLHFKRVCYSVTGQMVLDSGFVRYPKILDLNDVVILPLPAQFLQPSIKSNTYEIDSRYRLSAVIEHFGSAHGGHYVAYRRLFPSESFANESPCTWVVCDDSKIEMITETEVLHRKAYMLMYERISEGPINYNWNLRYVVLDGIHTQLTFIESNQELTYYQNETEDKPNGVILLAEALISNITLIREREHSFSIQTAPPNGRIVFFSCDTEDESIEWRQALIDASSKHKIKKAMNSFNVKDQRSSLIPSNQEQQQAWKDFDENQIFNDDSNYFDITQQLNMKNRNTFTQGPNKHFNSSSQLGGGSPDQPFRMSKLRISPQPFNRSAHDSDSDQPSVTRPKDTSPFLPKMKWNIENSKKWPLDIGAMSKDQADYLQKIQKMIQEDRGQNNSQTSNAWETLAVKDGMLISAMNPQPVRISLNIKQIKALCIAISLVFIVFNLLRHYIFEDLSYIYLGIAMQLTSYLTFKNILEIKAKYSLLKAKSLVSGSPAELGHEILRSFSDNLSDHFDYFTIQSKEINRDEEKHLITTEETLDLPSTFMAKQFLERRHMKVVTYWCQDESGCFYTLRKSLPSANPNYLKDIQEAFVCVPSANPEAEKCLIYFFSDFNYGVQGPAILVSKAFQDQVKVERMSILASLIQYCKQSSLDSIRKAYNVTQEVQLIQANADDGHGMLEVQVDDDAPFLRSHSISTNQGGDQQFISAKARGKTHLHDESGGQVKKLKESALNIKVKLGQRLGVSDRFPGYFRLENGALWCHNLEELSSQSGIIVEIIQKAGKLLMEGQGIVAISLPVRIFEKRSTIERICDLWCTGPVFLKKAAIETLGDPVERMKYVISFVISGMHMVASQRKPFNPIIGETYEGYWPDGSSIYVEHVSHHPPISCFEVVNVDGLYTLEGSYEYTAKVTDLGNSVTGRQVGKNRLRFADGSFVEWEYPFMKIQGLLFGKRTTHWVGGIEFKDDKNNIQASLEFSKEGGLFSRQTLPLDCIEGKIIKSNAQVSNIQGSWLEFLRFDDKLYWELETCDTVRPVGVDKPLPSDCRYREDSIAFSHGDLDFAQKEKERLEELQRRDKRLRESFASKRKNK